MHRSVGRAEHRSYVLPEPAVNLTRSLARSQDRPALPALVLMLDQLDRFPKAKHRGKPQAPEDGLTSYGVGVQERSWPFCWWRDSCQHPGPSIQRR